MKKRKNKAASQTGKRIGAYIRVSTQRQATEGDSLEAQQCMISRFIDERQQFHGWQVEKVTFYIDKGKSAKDQNRPELQRLRRDAADGVLDTVVCCKLDRITRSVLDFADLWNHFTQCGVELLSLKEKIDTTDAMGEAMVMIVMVFAQLERRLTGERTVDTMQERLQLGLWNGGHIYGYRPDPDNKGKLILDSEWAAKIQVNFFDAFERLGSAGAVQRELLALGGLRPAASDKER